MSSVDITTRRLHNQHLIGKPFQRPEDVVQWLGAVQSQDYGGAKWGVAQRTVGATDSVVDDALNRGTILRTHVMRPTWHFVMPADIRWLLQLTRSRVIAVMAYYDRKLLLDDAVFARSHTLITKALQGGKQLTRPELAAVLKRGGIEASGQRLGHLVMRAELDAVICSGALRGKQFTYALLEDRVPPVPPLTRDEALAELTRRYFTGHGPALVKDYAGWSGLTIADVNRGVELVGSQLTSEPIDGRTYWSAASRRRGVIAPDVGSPVIHLLPNYDEHLIAYKDHRASFDAAVRQKIGPDDDVLNAHIITLNGRVIGGWRRTISRRQITIEARLLIALKKPERLALQMAADSYGAFLGLPVTIEYL